MRFASGSIYRSVRVTEIRSKVYQLALFFHRKKVGRTNVWKTRDGVNLMRGRATDSLNGEIAEGFSTENFFMFFQNVEVIPK